MRWLFLTPIAFVAIALILQEPRFFAGAIFALLACFIIAAIRTHYR